MTETYDILKEIRRIRKKHYEETKNMSLEERLEFDRQKHKKFKEKIAKMNFKDGKYVFPFINYPKNNENQNNNSAIGNS
ncbi:MAG: hypothetical protein LBC20_04485 [Planctomycetaceae bacterium]|jgi:hypothetical protein|nr:hypothetical protein [Planctomycetaceae bacterium]